jgi:[methyl-Co(III) methanol-specific corrinoid protein]:coenzyme M methyltransferase
MANLTSRERVLRLFKRELIDRIPVFSGMGNVTVHGLEKYGLRFADVHTDPDKMAKLAASTFELFGFECAVVPFDMGIEAEALGCKVNFYGHRDDVLYPTVTTHLADKVDDLDFDIPKDLAKAGRIPVVVEAIRLLKKRVGDQVAVGSWCLGPHLILGQVTDVGNLAKSMIKLPDKINKLLDKTTQVVIQLSKIYREAGADYFTVREMGAGADILSPNLFRKLVKPHLQQVFAAIDSPNSLHICGDTNAIIEDMAACGADSISVEEKNHMAESRKKLGPDALIFGNIAGFTTLVGGKPADVDAAVKAAIDNGSSAIWPGCDIWPTVPKENMQAMMAAAEKYGATSAGVMVFTGAGKGKTTAAVGVALRMIARDRRVIFVHFTGPQHPVLGEVKAAAALGSNWRTIGIKSEAKDTSYLASFTESVDTVEEALTKAHDCWLHECDLLVLDDIGHHLSRGGFDMGQVLSLIDNRPRNTSVILTGIYIPELIVQKADLVTKFLKIKQPKNAGTHLRKGINF